MAYAVVAHRNGKSPLAKFVTLDEDEANKMVADSDVGGRGGTFYKVETYNPDVHTGQPKFTPEAEAEVGAAAIAQGQLNRIADGYNDQAELDGERPTEES